MSEEWGPWVEHDGMGCPVRGLWVRASFDKGFPLEMEGVALGYYPRFPNQWDWKVCESTGKARIIRYRIRRPKALQQLIHMVENLPAHKPTYEDA